MPTEGPDYQFVDGTMLSSVVEAIIFASPEPIGAKRISNLLTEHDDQVIVESERIEELVDKLNKRYDENGLSFRIQQTGGGYTFSTRQRYHSWLSIFQHENAYRRLSQSAIETLAIVAYKQPITKPEVDQIRGVDSGYILRQLMEKALIHVSGRADSPGKPLLYATTEHFLKHFGINSVDELPRPREIEEILKDDDMAEHRQFLFEKQAEGQITKDLWKEDMSKADREEDEETTFEVQDDDEEVEQEAESQSSADNDEEDEK